MAPFIILSFSSRYTQLSELLYLKNKDILNETTAFVKEGKKEKKA